MISSFGLRPAFSAGDCLNGDTIMILLSFIPTSAPIPSKEESRESACIYNELHTKYYTSPIYMKQSRVFIFLLPLHEFFAIYTYYLQVFVKGLRGA